jgi:hypothetical protein
MVAAVAVGTGSLLSSEALAAGRNLHGKFVPGVPSAGTLRHGTLAIGSNRENAGLLSLVGAGSGLDVAGNGSRIVITGRANVAAGV